MGLIPSPAQWVKGAGTAETATAAQIRSLAWEAHMLGGTKKKKKKKQKQGSERVGHLPEVQATAQKP